MVNKVDLIELCDLRVNISVEDVIALKQSYQKLVRSLDHIRNNLMQCIPRLENNIEVKSDLTDTMKDIMKEIEHAREAIYIMQNFKLESTQK